MATRLRVLVCGMIAGDPGQGGATWAVLQYVLGLRGLGHDVYLVEPIGQASIRPGGATLEGSTNAVYFRDVVTSFDLHDRAALLQQNTRETIGVSYADLGQIARTADLLINISGMLTDPLLMNAIPRRVYLDLDPAFNQLWHAVEGLDMRFEGHTHFVTVGLALGTPACDLPTCGRQWLPTLQPVVLTEWPVTTANPSAAWTTVGNWRGYGSIRHRGVLFGQKAHSLRRFISLPAHTTETVRLALSIDAAEVNDLEALRTHRWEIVNPSEVAGTPDDYRHFIQQSKGELGIAKNGYVESRCGWFSDRSVCYLASGRPVVAQDTGFSSSLPVGEGLCAFTTLQEAVDAMELISLDYEKHCRRAREIAEEYFRAERTLGRLLERIDASPEPGAQGPGNIDASTLPAT